MSGEQRAIPQISYASTSADLSDKSRFEYFSRVVPPDNYQAQAMADTARALGWTFVNTLADSGTYGEKGIQAFVEATKNSGLCISRAESIPRGADDSKLRAIVDSLLRGDNNAKAIMMFANEDNSRRVVQAISRLNKTDSVYLLASDSWGAKVHPVYRQEADAEGTVTILPMRSVIPGFDEYFLNLTLEHTRNPWFKEFWSEIFNCTIENFRNGVRPCTGNESLRNWKDYNQEGLVQFVIDSVYALAHAVNDMLTAYCTDGFVRCPILKQLSGPVFLQFIRNVSFIGISGDEVKFNKNGDSLGRYDIFQFQKVNDEFKYIKVGQWLDSFIELRAVYRERPGQLRSVHSRSSVDLKGIVTYCHRVDGPKKSKHFVGVDCGK
ncbi:Metabotropic glutamate receptor 4 [Bulinus truncatus]|nr:Metabotropic glutamate receptor 4 [Bulinus truncatus]